MTENQSDMVAGVNLQRRGPALASPPKLSIDSLTLSPLNSDWQGETGSRVVTEPPENFTVNNLSPIALSDTVVRARIMADQLPDQVSITHFDEIDESGIPVGGGRDEDCATSDTCLYRFDSDEEAVHLEFTTGPTDKVIIIHVYYVRPEVVTSESQSQEPMIIGVSNIETNYASYGFRTTKDL